MKERKKDILSETGIVGGKSEGYNELNTERAVFIKIKI